MELNQAKLSRLQLFGTLAIVFMLALTLSSYFLLSSWNDFQTRQHTIRQDAYARARATTCAPMPTTPRKPCPRCANAPTTP
ncbi:hypothetical protein JOS77_10395 [Chromobacterium haemolyticum]|nr:hypothetical protein JOS77_10395 [Chromobacterium haemolyticum]